LLPEYSSGSFTNRRLKFKIDRAMIGAIGRDLEDYMMNFELISLREGHIKQFKSDMQEAFQQGAVDSFGEMDEQILPESHIEHSLTGKGAAAYEALVDGVPVGGAIVVIDEEKQHNYLDFLFVKAGKQSKGVGQAIWNSLERLYPDTKIWETCTPYFEKRNIHFYVNKCGFHIVEFFNQYHIDPNDAESHDGKEKEYFEGIFRFEKIM